MGKKERKNECLASFKVYCIHVFRFFFYLQCLEIYFLTKGEYGSSPVVTCLLELEVGAFWSSNATGYGGKKKKKNPMSPASKRLVTPESLLYLISAKPRGMLCWSMWTVSPFSHWTIICLAAKKCHSQCPLAPLPAALANRPQRLSSPFTHRSCSLSVSVVVVPAQAFYMLFLDYWKLEVLLPVQHRIYGWGDNFSLPGDNLASLCQC